MTPRTSEASLTKLLEEDVVAVRTEDAESQRGELLKSDLSIFRALLVAILFNS